MAIQGFDKEYYLQAKLDLLAEDPEYAEEWADGTPEELEEYFASQGLTAEEHYVNYGRSEGLEPNAFFDADEYIAAKAEDLVAKNPEQYADTDAARQAFLDAWGDRDPYEHYLQYGAKEGINPSNAFDAEEYYEAKLTQLQTESDLADDWAGKSVSDLREYFEENGINPLTHFIEYGRGEGIEAVAVGDSDTSELTEALGDLQEANAGVATAAEDMNAGLGEEDTPAEYDASEEGVEAAREDAQAAFEEVEGKRDELVEATAVEVSGDLGDGVQKYLGDNIALTEANLTTALEGVQAEIDADTVVYTKSGAASTAQNADGNATVTFELYEDGNSAGEDNDQLLDLSGIDVEKSGDIIVNLAEMNSENGNKNDNNSGGADTIVLPELADYAGSLTIANMTVNPRDPSESWAGGADTLVAADLADLDSATFKAENNGYITATLATGAEGSVSFTNVLKAETFLDALVDFDLVTVTYTEGGETKTASDLASLSLEELASAQLTEIKGVALEDPVALADGDVISALNDADTGLGADGFASLLEEYGSLKASASTSGLEKVGYTLADLQQEMLEAQDDLTSARDANSDADLLDTVRDTINAHIGAGGVDANTDSSDGGDLLALRDSIATKLDAEDFDGKVDLSADVDVTSDALLSALAGVELNTDDAAVTTGAKAPTSFAGQGEWVQGNEVEGSEGTYEWTYQPTAEEQSLLDALSAVEDRETLINDASDAENTFEGTTLGGQLGAIEDRLDTLESAEQAVVDAQAELDDANGLIDGLESALADQDTAEQWFTDNDYALPVTLDADQSATADGDIYVFAEDEGEAFSISGFGEEGQDTLYFGGDYTVTELGADQEITDRVGNVDTLEIFAKQDGDDMQLFVEANAAAGYDRGELADDQMTQITLENFSADDIAGFDGQSLIAGVAPQETVEVA